MGQQDGEGKVGEVVNQPNKDVFRGIWGSCWTDDEIRQYYLKVIAVWEDDYPIKSPRTEPEIQP